MFSFTAWPAALRSRLSGFARRRPAAAGGLVFAALLLAGCSGFTTGATNIAKQSDGSYSAQLNFVVSCGASENCSWYVHYRLVGSSTWTNVPSTPRGPWAGAISNVSLSETVTGLTPGAQYEYQVCGNWQPGQRFICVGPDDQTNTTTKFTTATWTTQTTPNPSGATSISLTAVSCTSATACMAVGQYETSGNSGPTTALPLAEFWDGTTWAMQTPPASYDGFSVPGTLSAVSCTSATACTAVGYFVVCSANGCGVGPLADRWDGTSWTVQPTPYEPGNGAPAANFLNGVSCTSATACTAIGYYLRNGCCETTLAEFWDGNTWTIQTTPNPSSTGNGDYSLTGLSCTSAMACIAVGSSNGATLVEAWDGTSWTIQTSPSPGNSGLNGVSCTSATSCIAVGYSNGSTLAEQWDGSTWTTQTTPGGGSLKFSLNGVSCFSATVCTAVGGPLAERWDGRTWTTIQTTAAGSSLNGVSCSSATVCTAVGGTLAERYSG